MTLVHSGQPRDDIESLRARATGGLKAALSERGAELARTQTDLEAFRIRYRREVGGLYEELDELERGIAEAELVSSQSA